MSMQAAHGSVHVAKKTNSEEFEARSAPLPREATGEDANLKITRLKKKKLLLQDQVVGIDALPGEATRVREQPIFGRLQRSSIREAVRRAIRQTID